MKLKNKKTGEIKECVVIPVDSNGYPNEYQVFEKGESLAELNEEWCDYEEPKEDGLDNIIALVEAYSSNDSERYPKEIVEKLKAWKRLKDKGFSIYSWDYEFDMVDKPSQTIILRATAVDTSKTDLDLLFRR